MTGERAVVNDEAAAAFVEQNHSIVVSEVLTELGLEGLASHILGVKMDKDWRIRGSDWAAETLTQRQAESSPVSIRHH